MYTVLVVRLVVSVVVLLITGIVVTLVMTVVLVSVIGMVSTVDPVVIVADVTANRISGHLSRGAQSVPPGHVVVVMKTVLVV